MPQSDLLILGTDTDAGKTTFALHFLSQFFTDFDYWKPLASGVSDAETVRRLVPDATVHPPLLHFEEAVAPMLAARHLGLRIPSASEIWQRRPQSNKPLLIESFGSPFSPLNEDELQIAMLRLFEGQFLLVTNSQIGAVGRTVQTLRALANEGIIPWAVVLVGPNDPFAEEQIFKHGCDRIMSLTPPEEWTPKSITRVGAKLAWEELIDDQPPRKWTKRSPRPWQRPSLLERDRSSLWHPYTPLQTVDEMLLVESAWDEFLKVQDKGILIDAISSWWTIQHGHRHPQLLRAMYEAANRLDHVLFAGVTHQPGIELAEHLLKTIPGSGGRVFYSDTGSSAVEVALKVCYQHWCHHGEPQRTLFVAFENGYHGDTFGTMSIGRDPDFFGRFEPLLFQVVQIPLDANALATALEKDRGRLAGVILEPLVQGASGMRMHSPEFLQQICLMTQQAGLPFIADEVMTGGGRTGTRWAFEQAGITPDLVCVGKTLAGGMLPLAATVVSKPFVESFNTDDRKRTFFHSHSFTGHPLACAVAVRNFELMESNLWQLQVQAMERFWHAASDEWRMLPRVQEVRIRGSIAAIELRDSEGYFSRYGSHLKRVSIENGVLLRPLGNVLYAMPPFCTSRQSLEKIAVTMTQAIQSLPGE
jgi:adenosylmethionine-8-amino-7-oxononanoate transaminase